LETLAMGDGNLDVGDVGTRETLKKVGRNIFFEAHIKPSLHANTPSPFR
jgi:hypothetical protein